MQHMISSMQRLGFTQSATIEHRKLAVDLAEVIIEWEKRRYKEEKGLETPTNVVAGNIKKQNDTSNTTAPIGVKRPGADLTDTVNGGTKRPRGTAGQVKIY